MQAKREGNRDRILYPPPLRGKERRQEGNARKRTSKQQTEDGCGVKMEVERRKRPSRQKIEEGNYNTGGNLNKSKSCSGLRSKQTRPS